MTRVVTPDGSVQELRELLDAAGAFRVMRISEDGKRRVALAACNANTGQALAIVVLDPDGATRLGSDLFWAALWANTPELPKEG